MKLNLPLLGLFSVVIAIVLLVVSTPLARFRNKIKCESSGKQFLTLTNNQNVCENRHSDTGKSCQTSKECEGFCGYIDFETNYPNRPREKGECSEYDNPNQCYRGIPNGKSFIYSMEDSEKMTIRICPSEMLR